MVYNKCTPFAITFTVIGLRGTIQCTQHYIYNHSSKQTEMSAVYMYSNNCMQGLSQYRVCQLSLIHI